MGRKLLIVAVGTFTVDLPDWADVQKAREDLLARFQSLQAEVDLPEIHGLKPEDSSIKFFVQPAPADAKEMIVPLVLGIPKRKLSDMMDLAINWNAVSTWCDKIEVAKPSGKDCAPYEEILNGGVLAFNVPDEDKTYYLDLDKLVTGFGQYISLKLPTSREFDIDGTMADGVIQCALFGELRYS